MSRSQWFEKAKQIAGEIERQNVDQSACDATRPCERPSTGEVDGVVADAGDVLVADDVDARQEPIASDWCDHINDEDREYLLGPRSWPGPCPWCSGRLRHNPLCDELRESWQPKLPWGKHKGLTPSQVPDKRYLRWFYRHCYDQNLKSAIADVLQQNQRNATATEERARCG
jgi:hypothetical protein